MRTACFSFLPVIVLLAGPAIAGDELSAQFHELELTIARGIHDKDRDLLDHLLSAEFVLRGNPDIDRDRWIRNAVELCWGDVSNIERFEVLPQGDAAVVTFLFTLYREPISCQAATIRSLITDVWVREAGDWRLRLRHSAPAAETGGPDYVRQQFLLLPEPPPTWEGTGELSLVSTAGNADTETIGASGEISFRPGPWSSLVRLAFIRSEADGVENARSFGLQLRQSRKISSKLEAYGRGTYRRDTFAGIDHRIVGDTGLAYEFVATRVHSLKLDAGVGYLNENRLTARTLTTPVGNAVVTYRWRVNHRAELTNHGNFTASFEEGDDWRYANTAAITASLSQTFSLKLSHALNYVNRPVPGFERADTIVSAALVAKLKR
jgi:putative salt-induced outer membrane protein YdiY